MWDHYHQHTNTPVDNELMMDEDGFDGNNVRPAKKMHFLLPIQADQP